MNGLKHCFRVPSKWYKIHHGVTGKKHWFCSNASATAAAPTNKIRPRRAFMYMPANNNRFVEKATELDVDTIVFDLEDAIAPNKKEEARANTINILENYYKLNKFQPRSEIVIRINPVTSGLAQDDINTVLYNCGKMPDAICLPKIEDKSEIEWLANEIENAKIKNTKVENKDEFDQIEIIGMIETPKSVRDANSICGMAPGRLTGMVFGGDDYAATINAIRTESNHEVNFARNMVLLHSKIHNLQCIDIVNINYKTENNKKIFQKEAIEGFEMGFDGKQVIHPIQAFMAQEAFSPKKAKIDWALEIVTKYNENAMQGLGAFELNGSMIDMPTVKQAENLVAKAKACGLI